MSVGDSDVSVSVVIPAFNAERFLLEAINSVRVQAHSNIEIIVVDDGSTDRTFQIASDTPGIKVIRQSNGGIGAARNAGVKICTGELLAFLDADDLWSPDKLQRQLTIAEDFAEIDLITGRVRQFYDASHPLADTKLPEFHEGEVAGTLLIPTERFHKVGWFNTELTVGEFIDWFSRSKSLGLRSHRSDAIILERRIHDQNTGVRRRDARSEYLKTLKAHLDRRRAKEA
ncbi:glycosyltransferase involved in cell wall biosynthesis [Rhodopirellula rubra]|uniref:Glycosyltransferase involved in cell wall biosynthesis n=1 Tax=Aporhodopirellula rubra TaxID=980271 RepID=A0A7W5DXW0_9BACT|nr:glycosyltransferase family A protein [Aporhodopirellula rubra]MBB3206187.1 glycosyltransferase involved in cell wall biosynthesis [Aporhodopirellula rubra]